MKPLISVIVRTYNRNHLLTEALESILNQSFKHLEIIVVDDGSTDDTPAIMKEYSDRVIYIRQNKSGGASALNKGIRHAAGNFIAFLDDDDLWQPEMLSQMHQAMVANPDVAVVYSNCVFFRHPNKDKEIKAWRKFYSGQIFEKLLQEGNFIPLDSTLVRKSCIEKVGMFDNSLGAAQDWDLWLKISCRGFEFLHIDKPLLKVRLHTGNSNRNLINLARSHLYVLQKISTSDLYKKSKVQSLIPRLISQKYAFLGRALIKRGLVAEGRKALTKSVNDGSFLRNVFSIFLWTLSFVAPRFLLSTTINMFESIFGKDKRRFYR